MLNTHHLVFLGLIICVVCQNTRYPCLSGDECKNHSIISLINNVPHCCHIGDGMITADRSVLNSSLFNAGLFLGKRNAQNDLSCICSETQPHDTFPCYSGDTCKNYSVKAIIKNVTYCCNDSESIITGRNSILNNSIFLAGLFFGKRNNASQVQDEMVCLCSTAPRHETYPCFSGDECRNHTVASMISNVPHCCNNGDGIITGNSSILNSNLFQDGIFLGKRNIANNAQSEMGCLCSVAKPENVNLVEGQ